MDGFDQLKASRLKLIARLQPAPVIPEAHKCTPNTTVQQAVQLLRPA